MAEPRLPPGMRVVDPHEQLWEGYSLRELLARPELLAPPMPIADRLLWQGRQTMLAGTDKIGKSTLARQAAVAITTGGYFLGARANEGVPGPVLWVGLEEALGDMVRPFANMGANPDQLDIVFGVGQHGMAAVRQAVGVKPYVAVVLDTLSALGSACGIESERNETEMTALMQDILSIARHPAPFGGPAVLTLHHHTRPGEGGQSRERGSGAIPANCDVVLNMNPRKGDGSVIEVQCRGRGGMAPAPFALKSVDQKFLLTDAAPAPVALVIRQTEDVWHYLSRNPHTTASAIARDAGIKKATVLDILAELEHEGRATNAGTSPKHPDWIAVESMVPVVPGTTGTTGKGGPNSVVPVVPPLQGWEPPREPPQPQNRGRPALSGDEPSGTTDHEDELGSLDDELDSEPDSYDPDQ